VDDRAWAGAAGRRHWFKPAGGLGGVNEGPGRVRPRPSWEVLSKTGIDATKRVPLFCQQVAVGWPVSRSFTQGAFTPVAESPARICADRREGATPHFW
jgi:hypothetical protein